jgi:short-subunit dehydrogenase
MELSQTRVVITGAASGIGLALLQLLAAKPVRIVAADVNEAGLRQACAAFDPAQVTPAPGDVSAVEGVDRLFDAALTTLGGIDLFIANAGSAYFERIQQPDWRHIEQIFSINVFGPLYSLEKLRALQAGRPCKMVINASAMAQIAVPGYALYAATKAALDRFADGYRWEMTRPQDLMLVYPISTRTGFFDAAGENVPIPWPSQSPEAVARTILRGIERDARSVYPSRLYFTLLVMDRWLPFIHWLIQWNEMRRFRRWASHSRQ